MHFPKLLGVMPHECIPGSELQGSHVHDLARHEMLTACCVSAVPGLTTCTAPRYQINHEVGFTSGQRAYSDYLQISDDITQVKLLNDEALSKGAGCMQSHGHQVCPCYVRQCKDPAACTAGQVGIGACVLSSDMMPHTSDSCSGMSGCAGRSCCPTCVQLLPDQRQ